MFRSLSCLFTAVFCCASWADCTEVSPQSNTVLPKGVKVGNIEYQRNNVFDLSEKGMLTSPEAAAARVLAWLDRPDFGSHPVADVRDA